MVVLAASILSKSGRALFSRQFVDMSRLRVEGLLAAFPKLVETGKEHTYVEFENVRYVYQPIDTMYLLLVTNKHSNILEDLETLRLLANIVPVYSPSLDEEGILNVEFELIFAFDEVISLGHKESVTISQVKQHCEMDSHEEKMHMLKVQNKINLTKDIMMGKACEIDKRKINLNKCDKGGTMALQLGDSGRIENTFSGTSGTVFGSIGHSHTSAIVLPKGIGMQLGKTSKGKQFLQSLKAEGEVIPEDVQPSPSRSRQSFPPADLITFTIEEKLNVRLKRDGGVLQFDLDGTLSVQILNQDHGLIQIQIETEENSGICFRTNPRIDRDMFSNGKKILAMRDPNNPFPTCQSGDVTGAALLKWRMQSMDESVVPLAVNCWPSVSTSETCVCIEYESSSMFDLRNVVILVPLPTLQDPPKVSQIDGEWRYDSRSSILEWSILLIDRSNRRGSIEFIVPSAHSSVFFPITVRFTAMKTFSDLKVVNVLPLRGGPSPKFSERKSLSTETYKVI